MSFEDAFLEIDISSWLNIFFNLYSRFNRLVFFTNTNMNQSSEVVKPGFNGLLFLSRSSD